MWCGNSYLIKHVRRLRIKDPKPNYMGRIIFIAVKWFLSYCDSATACPLNFGHGMLPSCWLYTALKEEMSLQPIPLKTLVILVLKDTKSCALNGHFWNFANFSVSRCDGQQFFVQIGEVNVPVSMYSVTVSDCVCLWHCTVSHVQCLITDNFCLY